MPGWLRGALILTAFLALTVPLMPIQAVLLRLWPRAARRLPHWYHRQVCRLIGVRLRIVGAPVDDTGCLLIANHTSWLDIPVLASLAPLAFVAKRDVAGWPLIGTLARLQRTVFVDRARRQTLAGTNHEIAARLAGGDTIVLFAEGTSSDGNQVLPFMSSLFAAVAVGDGEAATPRSLLRPLAIAYVARHGLPLSRHERPAIGWYGDMEMTRHAWALLCGGPIDVELRIGAPLCMAPAGDRKALAGLAEREVRRLLTTALRRLPVDCRIDLAERPRVAATRPRPGATGSSSPSHFR